MTLSCVFTSNPLGCLWSSFPWWVQWGLPILLAITVAAAAWHVFSLVRGVIGPWGALSAVGAILLAVAGIWFGRRHDAPDASEHFPDGHPDVAKKPVPAKKGRLGSKDNPIFGKW